jgi:hypothetical protein
MFFSNLAAGADSGGLWRVGVGASQTAESLLAAIAELRRPIMKQLIIKVAYEKALAAAAALEPHLKILNAGKGSETGPPERAGFGSLRSAAAAAPEAARPSQSQVETAAAALYDFLVAEQNPLRAVLALLSGGGSFYAAAVAEKTARAAREARAGDEGGCAARGRCSGLRRRGPARRTGRTWSRRHRRSLLSGRLHRGDVVMRGNLRPRDRRRIAGAIGAKVCRKKKKNI